MPAINDAFANGTPGSVLYFGQTAPAAQGMIHFVANSDAVNDDYGRLTTIPDGIGDAEFSLHAIVRPNNTYPFGLINTDNENNWITNDPQPPAGSGWNWYDANWIIDGFNNTTTLDGSFGLSICGGGNIRAMVADGTNFVTLQSWPSVNRVIDGSVHLISIIRRFSGADTIWELWVDGALIDSETVNNQINFATTYWDAWTGFPADQPGWWFGCEKLSALNLLGHQPDFKGELRGLGFYNAAHSGGEIGQIYAAMSMLTTVSGYVDRWRFLEGSGTTAASDVAGINITLLNGAENQWGADNNVYTP